MSCTVGKVNTKRECTSNIPSNHDPFSLLALSDDVEDIIAVSCPPPLPSSSSITTTRTCYNKQSIQRFADEQRENRYIKWPHNQIRITDENSKQLLQLFGVVVHSKLNFERAAMVLSPTPFWSSSSEFPKNAVFMINLLSLKPFAQITGDMMRMASYGTFATLHICFSNPTIHAAVEGSNNNELFVLMMRDAVAHNNTETVVYLLQKPAFDFLSIQATNPFVEHKSFFDQINLEWSASVSVLNAFLGKIKNRAAQTKLSEYIAFETARSSTATPTDIEQALNDWKSTIDDNNNNNINTAYLDIAKTAMKSRNFNILRYIVRDSNFSFQDVSKLIAEYPSSRAIDIFKTKYPTFNISAPAAAETRRILIK